jgi:putative membrane protein
MLGSLNKVWPWKYTLAYTINRHGEEVPLLQDNLLPSSYEVLTGLSAGFWPAVALMILGALLGVVMDRQQH